MRFFLLFVVENANNKSVDWHEVKWEFKGKVIGTMVKLNHRTYWTSPKVGSLTKILLIYLQEAMESFTFPNKIKIIKKLNIFVYGTFLCEIVLMLHVWLC